MILENFENREELLSLLHASLIVADKVIKQSGTKDTFKEFLLSKDPLMAEYALEQKYKPGFGG